MNDVRYFDRATVLAQRNQRWRSVLPQEKPKRVREPWPIYMILVTEVIGIAAASVVLIDKLR